MSSLVDTLEHAGLVLSGAVVCFLFLQWRRQKGLQEEDLAGGAIVNQARREAEIILRDAKVAASEEALRLHAETEVALASRRAERLELERRLAEREALINSQLQRVVEAENTLDEEKEALRKRAFALASQENELAELERHSREQLQKVAGLSAAEAREALLSRIEKEALRDANTITRHILEEAKAKAEEKARRIITMAIQRYAGEHTFENTTASISLNGGDDIKGGLIVRAD